MAVVVVQARMGSTRLPGKVLRPLGPAGRPVLGWVVRAGRLSGVADPLVVATSTARADDALAAWCHDHHVACVRGDEADVLGRFCCVLDHVGADDKATVVRLTADCPLLDPNVIAMAVAAFDCGDVDYLSTVTPRSLPTGLDVEVTTAGMVRWAGREARGADRSHVTSWLYREPGRCRVAGLAFFPDSSDLRVTLDTPQDASLLDELVRVLGDRPPTYHEVVSVLRAAPGLVALNAGVRRKGLDEG